MAAVPVLHPVHARQHLHNNNGQHPQQQSSSSSRRQTQQQRRQQQQQQQHAGLDSPSSDVHGQWDDSKQGERESERLRDCERDKQRQTVGQNERLRHF